MPEFTKQRFLRLVYMQELRDAGRDQNTSSPTGGTTNVGQDLVQAYSIPANSAPIPVATGQLLSAGLMVYANSGTPNAINLTGYAIRST